ncbi:hypothetical protein QBC38DRAFT_469994 [Podospora fimiseda]|uniref:U1-type domain-containing protein n=1 Tax=Podospora fimiseda TaxID=252190 RepID=A0AAN7H6V9_9PEZI|nr:hypothetical protein QBC38DRAFT_469994 [Podospora fimiseda]
MRFRVRGGQTAGTASSTSTSENEDDAIPDAVGILSPSRPKRAASPSKRVVFSTENLLSIRAMLDEARGRGKSRSKSPPKTRQPVPFRERDQAQEGSERSRDGQQVVAPVFTPRQILRPPHPSVSPIRPQQHFESRPMNPMAPKFTARRQTSSSSSSSGLSRTAYGLHPTPGGPQISGRKRTTFNLDPREQLPAPTPKRRLLAEVNQVNGRQRLETPENEIDESSTDELGQLDELRMGDSVVVKRKRNFEVQSPVRRPVAKRTATMNGSSLAQSEQTGASVETNENHMGRARRRRGVSVWRLASPPKIKAVEVDDTEDAGSDDEMSVQYDSQLEEEDLDSTSGQGDNHHHELFLQRLGIGKDPDISKNDRGSVECRLCHTLHQSEASYLAHIHGKKHQKNILRQEEIPRQEEIQDLETPEPVAAQIEQTVEQGTESSGQEDSFSDLDYQFRSVEMLREPSVISQTGESAEPVEEETPEVIHEPEVPVTEPEIQEAAPTQSPPNPTTEPESPEAPEAPERNGDNADEENIVASEEHPITICGQRLYSDWTGTWDGKPCKVPGAGVLFPEGYQPRIGEPEPWICPIRDCQTIFPEAFALGGHFSASHRASLLNDNQDGTMSIIGKRQTKDPESGRMPALVISRKRLDPATAPPKADPHKPTRKIRASDGRAKTSSPNKLGNSVRKRPRPSATTPRSRRSLLVVDIPSNKSSVANAAQFQPTDPALWQYLCLYLPHNVPFPTNSLIKELISLPRQRELPHRWKLQLSSRSGPSINFLCAVLIYLAGDKMPGEPCKGCRSFKVDGKFPECVILPQEGISQELREHFNGRCSGCFYRGLEEYSGEDTEGSTTTTTTTTSEDEREITNTPSSVQSVVGRLTNGSSGSKLRVKPTVSAVDQRNSRTVASDAKEKNPPTEPTEPTENRVSLRPRPAASINVSRSTRRKPSVTAVKKATLTSTSPTLSSETMGRPYRMAPWEIAPGRISIRGAEKKTDNIAFSSTYLLPSSPPIPLTSTTTFQAFNVQPGRNISWPEEEGKLRVCSVAQGVVNVKLYGKEFSLGPNGMWKVPVGEGCEVGSVCYGGAVIHVCVFEGEEEE